MPVNENIMWNNKHVVSIRNKEEEYENDRYHVELTKAKDEIIKSDKEREFFKRTEKKVGFKTPPTGIVTTLKEGDIGKETPSFQNLSQFL